jgi:uncharacterized protein YjiS (DUF1127 family)
MQLTQFIFSATRSGSAAASPQRPPSEIPIASIPAAETQRAERAARSRTGVGRLLALCVEYVASWYRTRRDRRRLARLDDRMLRDIGLDRNTADRDSTASFWRLR